MCCNNWICDDEDQYVPFSYTNNSCYRNHSRHTICGIHYGEKHVGRWQECEECKKMYDGPMYAYFATNDYNFEPLNKDDVLKIKNEMEKILAEDKYLDKNWGI